jgi:flagellar protein FliO/FliZ
MMLQNALPAIGLLALMVLAAWLLQRYRRHLPGRAGHSAVPMEITGGISLGPQHRLLSVRIGQGPAQVHVVLGVTPQSIQAVATLPGVGSEFAAQLAAAAASTEDRS